MILKYGKKYKTRSGLIVGPLYNDNNGTNYKFTAKVQEPEYKTPSILSWLPGGWLLAVGGDHKLDLIIEL